MRYRKKPVVVEAVQYTNQTRETLIEWCGDKLRAHAMDDDGCQYETENLFIHTREGTMRAEPGDWIIRGVKGEFYPCKDDIFRATYELVTEPGS